MEGDKDYTRLVAGKIKRIARQYGAISLGGYAARKWEHTRYTEPYMREDLNDYGILIDTLEAGVTWDNLHRLHEGVRAYIKSRPDTMCLTHASHFYPQGTNLYFIFFARMNVDEYVTFQSGIIDQIHEIRWFVKPSPWGGSPARTLDGNTSGQGTNDGLADIEKTLRPAQHSESGRPARAR
ncbi:MAG: hypothetical protein MZV70_24305 [Desulfobacterales bacterium]|nr:hypothetical protein [Desulfobacterales bacterium]